MCPLAGCSDGCVTCLPKSSPRQANSLHAARLGRHCRRKHRIARDFQCEESALALLRSLTRTFDNPLSGVGVLGVPSSLARLTVLAPAHVLACELACLRECVRTRLRRAVCGAVVPRDHWAHGVVVSHPLRMRKALGSNPSVSTLVLRGLSLYSCILGIDCAPRTCGLALYIGAVAVRMRARPRRACAASALWCDGLPATMRAPVVAPSAHVGSRANPAPRLPVQTRLRPMTARCSTLLGAKVLAARLRKCKEIVGCAASVSVCFLVESPLSGRARAQIVCGCSRRRTRRLG